MKILFRRELVAAIGILLAILLGVVWHIFLNQPVEKPPPTSSEAPQNSSVAPSSSPLFQSYHSELGQISFVYPSELAAPIEELKGHYGVDYEIPTIRFPYPGGPFDKSDGWIQVTTVDTEKDFLRQLVLSETSFFGSTLGDFKQSERMRDDHIRILELLQDRSNHDALAQLVVGEKRFLRFSKTIDTQYAFRFIQTSDKVFNGVIIIGKDGFVHEAGNEYMRAVLVNPEGMVIFLDFILLDAEFVEELNDALSEFDPARYALGEPDPVKKFHDTLVTSFDAIHLHPRIAGRITMFEELVKSIRAE